ncbi:DUF6094 domain-containing protein [uncultured Helicobacter sp.]|uniref:DUF6094 domain-containing protein n=1 Tax=uncultured Helicobacter sp. TaxID=175537 RepID=UPI00263586C2|nr:DUF6094 domain-containing protein [uncultured Helicobacter sp.]
MARLESDKKLGFFPTNSATVNEFLDKISITGKQENFLVCDPCCGEGVALSLFKRFSGVKTYGVELDTERAKKHLWLLMSLSTIMAYASLRAIMLLGFCF